jgi:hypothetical protein
MTPFQWHEPMVPLDSIAIGAIGPQFVVAIAIGANGTMSNSF